MKVHSCLNRHRLLLLSLFFPAICISQEEHMAHDLTLMVGQNHITDKQLNFSGKTSTAGLSYSLIVHSISSEKGFEASWSRSIGSQEMFANEFNIEYYKLYKIKNRRESSWQHGIGYSINANPIWMKAGGEYSWATTNSIAIRGRSSYNWAGNSISLNTSVPIAGLISRPTINESTETKTLNEAFYNSYKDLQFSTLKNLQAVFLELNYNRQLTPKLFFHGGMTFDFKQMKGSGFVSRKYEVSTGLSFQL